MRISDAQSSCTYSFYYFIPDFHGAHEGVICALLSYGVVPFIFLLELEGNCYAVRKFTLWIAVFQEGAIFEESDVSQSQNVCPSTLPKRRRRCPAVQ